MQSRRPATKAQSVAGQRQVIIKIAGFKNKKMKRSAHVYEAINSRGIRVFFGISSSLVRTATGVLLEAVVEVSLSATNHGFQQVLFLCDSRDLIQAFNTRKALDWQDNARLAYLNFLVQNGLHCKMILVPHSLLNSLCSVAKRETLVPLNQCLYNLAFL